MHKAWHSMEEVPYCFLRSSIKFQGHTGWKRDAFNPIWVRLLGQSQLSNPSDLPCFFTIHGWNVSFSWNFCHVWKQRILKFFNISLVPILLNLNISDLAYVFDLCLYLLSYFQLCLLSMWGKNRKIIIPMYRLWLHLYGLHGPQCPKKGH